jgi:hypothetical protein
MASYFKIQRTWSPPSKTVNEMQWTNAPTLNKVRRHLNQGGKHQQDEVMKAMGETGDSHANATCIRRKKAAHKNLPNAPHYKNEKQK